MKKSKWNNRDWKWFIGILFGVIVILIIIIIFSLSYKLSNDRDMVNITSIGAGLVSIVLGIVAIIYAFFQANESSNTFSKIIEKVNEINFIKENTTLIKDTLQSMRSMPNTITSVGLSSNIENADVKKYKDLSLMWEFEFLKLFLVYNTKMVLCWLSEIEYFNYSTFYSTSPMIPSDTEKEATINALTHFALIRIDEESNYRITEKGDLFLRYAKIL